jgi:hypothetical protein
MTDETVHVITKKKGLGLRRKRGLGWRRGAPTPKQKDYLVMYGLSFDYGDDENWPITAGEANDIIYEHHLEQEAKPPDERDKVETKRVP